MHRTKQEDMWSGEFGNSYIERNQGGIENNIALFSEILKRTNNVNSVMEFGANIGLNLKAIKTLLPHVKCSAVEINDRAADMLERDAFFDKGVDVFRQSILEYEPDGFHDFILVKGILIHISPDHLEDAYKKMYHSSRRYVCIVEYYNPVPVTVEYRGNEDLLYKRDFAGEFMEIYPDFKLIDYGFKYHKDNNFPQDDLTWFLLGKV